MKPTKFALKKKVKWHYSPASTCCHPCLEDTASQQEEGLSSEKMYLLMLYLFCGVVAVTLFTVPFHFPVFVVSPSLYISITICTGIQTNTKQSQTIKYPGKRNNYSTPRADPSILCASMHAFDPNSVFFIFLLHQAGRQSSHEYARSPQTAALTSLACPWISEK